MRHEADEQSPSAGPFSYSQSTGRSSLHPGTSWGTDNVRDPTHLRLGSWVESQGSASETKGIPGLRQVLNPEIAEMRVPAETWTTITADEALVQHLLALYFCWEYLTFASLSKEHSLPR